ncbi:MAG: hypothetical protein ACK5HL_00785 [Bacilli bacterium]
MKKIIVMLITLLVIPLNIFAACNEDEKKQLQTLANEITIEANNASKEFFSYTVLNINEKIYVKDNNNFIYNYDKNRKLKDVETVNPNDTYPGSAVSGGQYEFKFYGSTGNCKDEYLGKKIVNIKYYNPFSTNYKCQEDEYKDFKYCAKVLNSRINDKQFYDAIQQFNKDNAIKEPVIGNKTNEKDISDYLIYIVITIIIILLAMTLFVFIKNKKQGKNKKTI